MGQKDQDGYYEAYCHFFFSTSELKYANFETDQTKVKTCSAPFGL